jgi:hypothetical protein
VKRMLSLVLCGLMLGLTLNASSFASDEACKKIGNGPSFKGALIAVAAMAALSSLPGAEAISSSRIPIAIKNEGCEAFFNGARPAANIEKAWTQYCDNICNGIIVLEGCPVKPPTATKSPVSHLGTKSPTPAQTIPAPPTTKHPTKKPTPRNHPPTVTAPPVGGYPKAVGTELEGDALSAIHNVPMSKSIWNAGCSIIHSGFLNATTNLTETAKKTWDTLCSVKKCKEVIGQDCTRSPTPFPTLFPSTSPTESPTLRPTTLSPTQKPTPKPHKAPTPRKTPKPTGNGYPGGRLLGETQETQVQVNFLRKPAKPGKFKKENR